MSKNQQDNPKESGGVPSSKAPTGADSREKARRRLLKHVAVGSAVFAGSNAVPEKWLRPVVESVVLPVHAQISPDNGYAASRPKRESFIVKSRPDNKSRKV